MSAAALARVLWLAADETQDFGGYSTRDSEVVARALIADPAPFLAALAEAGALEAQERARIHYRYGVNSGTLMAANTTASIEAAVRSHEHLTMGPVGVERIEVSTLFTHLTPWIEVPQ